MDACFLNINVFNSRLPYYYYLYACRHADGDGIFNLVNCTVTGVDMGKGLDTSHPLVGAKVVSTGHPAPKIVTLDVDNQNNAQIFGLSVAIRTKDNKTTLVTSDFKPAAFRNIRQNGPTRRDRSATWQSVLTGLKWPASPSAFDVINELQQLSTSSGQLSMRFMTDRYIFVKPKVSKGDSKEFKVYTGRLTGVIGSQSRGAPENMQMRVLKSKAAPAYAFAKVANVGKQKMLVIDLCNAITFNSQGALSDDNGTLTVFVNEKKIGEIDLTDTKANASWFHNTGGVVGFPLPNNIKIHDYPIKIYSKKKGSPSDVLFVVEKIYSKKKGSPSDVLFVAEKANGLVCKWTIL